MVIADRTLAVAGDGALRIAYVTSRFPFGEAETFLLPEAKALAARVGELRIVPMRTPRYTAHDDVRRVMAWSEREPLLSRAIAVAAWRELVHDLPNAGRQVKILRRSRSARLLTKNALVVPKALWLARMLRAYEIDHVHAHWGGTSSTLAMLAAKLADVSWSLTLHRWDIAEDNLLRQKVESAALVRAISEHGAREIRSLVPGAHVDVVHLGVETQREAVPDLADRMNRKKQAGVPLRLLAIGDLVPVKGHDLLLEAFSLLRQRAPRRELRLDIAGDGPLRATLETRAAELGISDRVTFLGVVSHDRLLSSMQDGEWDVIVHPSVDRDDLHEGIPVALMEAMDAGIPAVASKSGGVGELVRPGGGIVVQERHPSRFASAIEVFLDDPELAQDFGMRGRAHVQRAFAADRIADELVARFSQAARPRVTR